MGWSNTSVPFALSSSMVTSMLPAGRKVMIPSFALSLVARASERVQRPPVQSKGKSGSLRRRHVNIFVTRQSPRQLLCSCQDSHRVLEAAVVHGLPPSFVVKPQILGPLGGRQCASTPSILTPLLFATADHSAANPLLS